ncbi:hypothetical protein [Hydrogenovibrio marinus]|uniref:Thioredoxin-like fold domain-containing protein n=1 Tax=Hydrogenovibrio marinus TaxID=28885 RepID=A0A067A1L0_HYDMR|nr:hypothetical protein [Hydrogenovibrio marinus]KDN96210.1 hypothetical protein EI16_07950 [Hydrogenovibrio marinus]BBN60613.1 hypothetical protein HVMH_2207 [Hydrogenovibrio marinus]
MRTFPKLFLLSLVFVAFSVANVAQADDWQLKEATDFSVLSAQSKKDHLPIAIYFNMTKINASKRLKDMAILPMIENGIFDGYVHMVQITVDEPDETIKDFYGEPAKPKFFQEMYNVTSIPSIVFVDADGNEISKRMTNSGAYDYVPYYLKQRINQALKELGNKKRYDLQ